MRPLQRKSDLPAWYNAQGIALEINEGKLVFNPPDQGYHFVLLRHAESQGNARNFIQGQKDFPLTDHGRNQAAALAAAWEKIGKRFDRALCSPLQRARETATIVLAATNTPIEYDEILMERDHGIYSGLNHAEALQKYPQPDFLPPYAPLGHTGEGQWQLYLRAGAALQKLLSQPPGSYLVVSHGGLLNMLLYSILGLTVQANFQGSHFAFKNTAYTTLTYKSDEHRWQIWQHNEHCHLHELEK
jgi:broad specificity phosphatase PhoE